MTAPKRDDKERERKWLQRVRGSRNGEIQSNGSLIPGSELSDPRYKQIRGALPASMRSLFDDYIKSLIHPRKSQK